MSDKEGQQQEQKGCEHNFLEGKIKQKFQVLKKIGSGAYGHVWKVRCRQSKNIFAIKKVFLAFKDETDAQRVYREISLLFKLKHDNIVKIKQVLPSENHSDIYLLFEFLESDVFQSIKNRVLDQTHKKFIVYQMACGLKYLHSAGVVHRDLKPSNILINSNCDIKICDFGLSRSLKSQFFNKPIMTEFIATRWYRAPEVLMGSKFYSSKSDMWSLGCLIYELYSRRTLLPGQSTIDQITKLLQFKGKPTSKEIQSFKSSKSAQILTYFKIEQQPIEYYYDDLQNNQVLDLLNNLLKYDQNQRWSAEQILQCDFLRQFKDILPENRSKSLVTLQLNDNRKYSIDRYKNEIVKFINGKQENSKERPRSKRLFLSQRHSHKSNLSLHGQISKFAKPSLNLTTTLRGTKNIKYQSAHISPAERSLEKIARNSRKNILKVAERLTNDLRRKKVSIEGEKDQTCKKSSLILMKSKSKKYIRPQIYKETNKENGEGKLRTLKKQKIKYNRNDFCI